MSGMESGACSCDWDGESPTFCETTWPRARVEHVCCECGATIPRGARYQRTSGVWDGSWDRFVTCQTCAAIHKDWRCAPLGGLREYLRDALGVDYVTGDNCERKTCATCALSATCEARRKAAIVVCDDWEATW